MIRKYKELKYGNESNDRLFEIRNLVPDRHLRMLFGRQTTIKASG